MDMEPDRMSHVLEWIGILHLMLVGLHPRLDGFSHQQVLLFFRPRLLAQHVPVASEMVADRPRNLVVMLEGVFDVEDDLIHADHFHVCLANSFPLLPLHLEVLLALFCCSGSDLMVN